MSSSSTSILSKNPNDHIESTSWLTNCGSYGSPSLTLILLLTAAVLILWLPLISIFLIIPGTFPWFSAQIEVEYQKNKVRTSITIILVACNKTLSGFI